MRRKNQNGILERAAEAFDLPGEALAGMPKLTLTGNRRLHIEGHKGIQAYDSSLIAINGGAMLLQVHGENLEISSMSAEELLITGNISKIEFERQVRGR